LRKSRRSAHCFIERPRDFMAKKGRDFGRLFER